MIRTPWSIVLCSAFVSVPAVAQETTQSQTERQTRSPVVAQETTQSRTERQTRSPAQTRADDAHDTPPLHFPEVIESVHAHDPRIRKAIQDVEQARGRAQSARGAFDPTIKAEGSLKRGAYYDLQRLDAELRQPTSLWGSELFVGYRLGLERNDRWPTYYDDQTLSQGELRAGLRLPLWRDGLIDKERATRATSAFEQEAAEFGLQDTRLALELAAAKAYWNWISAGQRYRAAASLVQLAQDRDAQLRRRLAAGSIAEFDVTDNDRILLERRDALVAASRAFEKAALELAIFFRDEAGETIVATPERLPSSLIRPDRGELNVAEAARRVVQCHPEVNRARAKLDAVRVEERLAKNQLGPQVDLSFQVSRDLGDPTGTPFDETLPGTSFDAGLNFSMPLLLRTERGAATATRAKVRATQAEVDLLEDRLALRTADAASAVHAAQQRVTLTGSVVDTTADLARGERRRFEAGASNLIFVNLREQTAAAAKIRYFDAVALAEIAQRRWHLLTTLQSCGEPTTSS